MSWKMIDSDEVMCCVRISASLHRGEKSSLLPLGASAAAPSAQFPHQNATHLERNRDLLRVARAHAVRDDVHLHVVGKEVEAGLQDADVGLDADDDDGLDGPLVERLGDLGRVHGELGLRNGGRERVQRGGEGGQVQLWDGAAQSFRVLFRGVDCRIDQAYL
jgi:hypothetical protein